VVAVGAAIQGAQLMLGAKSEVLLLDVTPLSLGIETLGGVMTKLIEKNTTIPKTATEIFSTADDNQRAVTVRVFQGESPMANSSANRLLGQFNLEDIPPAPRGVPQIEVTFDIDHNGILHVQAKDKGTGKEKKIRIESSSGLSSTEIEKMRKEAESHAEEDKKRRDLVDARNKADQAIYEVEKTMKEAGDKLPESDKAPIRAAVESVRQAASGEDINAIEQAVSNLLAAAHAMAQHVGKGAEGARPGAPPSGDGHEKGKEDVIDAEFEVKK